jgi:hypothetical protein
LRPAGARISWAGDVILMVDAAMRCHHKVLYLRMGGVFKMKQARLLLSVCFCLVASGASAEPYLQGRFELDMKQSSFKGDPTFTGGFWVFEKDDGKTHTGYLVQFRKNGGPFVFYYDNTPYDGKLYWLNDWYREGIAILDKNTFSVTYEVRRDGMKEPFKGSAVCKINDDRSRFTCNVGESVEVYQNRG